MVNFLLALALLLLAPAPAPAVDETTSPFYSMPYGTKIDCYFEKDVNQLRCWIGGPDKLVYGISWDAMDKEKDKGLFRYYATATRQLVTPLQDYYDGMPVSVWVVSPGDHLPGTN